MRSAAFLSTAPGRVAGSAGGVCAQVASIHAALDALDIDGVVEGEHAPVLRELERASRRLDLARLAVLAAAEASQVGERAGLTGTGAWASETTKCDGADGASQAALARDVMDKLPKTRSALGEGAISADHAKIVASTVRSLPANLTEVDRSRIETRLVARARTLKPAGLRKAARRALEAAERSMREVDEHEDEQLRKREKRALERTRLTMHDNGDGTTTGRFTVPSSAGDMLKKIIQQIASPRREHLRDAREGKVDGGFAGGSGGFEGESSGSAGGSGGPTRHADQDWPHQYGLAFLEVLEHLPAERLSGKVNATVVVTMGLDQLRDGVGAACLDTGEDISAGEARRLACNAGLVPAVLDGASIPLDLGRQQRFFSEAQRVALATLYDSCAAVGCDRPYAWSELHHEDPWRSGGRTDLALAVPLCGYHHRRIHDVDFEAHITTDPATGVKTVRMRQRDQ